MMSIRKPSMFVSATAITVASALQTLAETEIANPNDKLNKHFEVASERYGKDEIQLQSRQEGTDGSSNKVYSINCARQMFKEVFAGETGPVDFPVPSDGAADQPIEKDLVVAPLAAHVCKQHGVPLVGIQW